VAVSPSRRLRTPIDHLSILFNYSFSDAYVTRGQAADPADPNALEPGAKPLVSPAVCAATAGKAGALCSTDVYSSNGNPMPFPNPYAGFQVTQNLAGNPLPNAPRNKIAINALYDYKTGSGVKFEPSVSWVWRDQQYGMFFKDPNFIAPSWDEWDARLTIASPNDRFEVIAFIKNIANTVGYDQGAAAFRAAGTVDLPCAVGVANPTCVPLSAILPKGSPVSAVGYQSVNYVQGLNGPAGFNNHLIGADRFGVFQTLYVTPPRTYGVELHYKFY
jgi:iron complex outermembrane receptor protein